MYELVGLYQDPGAGNVDTDTDVGGDDGGVAGPPDAVAAGAVGAGVKEVTCRFQR